MYSNHPIASRTIEKILTSIPYSVKPFSHKTVQDLEECTWVLVLDAYSVEQWLEVAVQCRVRGGRPIVILPESLQTPEGDLRLVYLGVQGIVPMVNLENELAQAIDSVAKGQLWLRRSTLNEYVRHTRPPGGATKPRLTLREEQIIALLAEGFSNKMMVNVLRVSDRTVKFHISNIFRKLHVKSRKDLLHIKRPTARMSKTALKAAG